MKLLTANRLSDGLTLWYSLTHWTEDAAHAAQTLATREGSIIPVLTPEAHGYPLEMLVREHSTCINTTAAGGNASLMTLA